jgi:hypothetical protein
VAIKIGILKNSRRRTKVLSQLPRFSLKVQAFNKTIDISYVPVLETLAKVIKERKGIMEASSELFEELEDKTMYKKQRLKRPNP